MKARLGTLRFAGYKSLQFGSSDALGVTQPLNERVIDKNPARTQFLMLSFILPILVAAAPAPARICSSPAVASYDVERIKQIVSATGNDADQTRQQFHLPPATADSVVLVTDEAVCAQAARTYYRYELGPIPAGRTAVIRIRDRYVVSGTIRAGEWSLVSVYSLRFEPIAVILM